MCPVCAYIQYMSSIHIRWCTITVATDMSLQEVLCAQFEVHCTSIWLCIHTSWILVHSFVIMGLMSPFSVVVAPAMALV